MSEKKPKNVEFINRMRVISTDGWTEIYDCSSPVKNVMQVVNDDITLEDDGNGWNILREGEEILRLNYCEAAAIVRSALFLDKISHRNGHQGLLGTRGVSVYSRVRKYSRRGTRS